MSGVSAAAVPSAGAWRVWVRGARRDHHQRSLGDVFSDLYTILWLVVVYGGALVSELRRHVQASSGSVALPAVTSWVLAAALLAATGLAWRALRAVGPLMATPAEQAWGVSTPVDRRGWLLPRFTSLSLVGALAAAVVATGTAFLASGTTALGWAALAGAACGAGGVSALVTAQSGSSGYHRRWYEWPRLAGSVLVASGAVLTLVTVTAHYAGVVLPAPVVPPLAVLAVVVVLSAMVAVVFALRSLSGVRLAALNAGADVASAAMTSTVALDPSLLTRVLEVRRWRGIGKVHSRRFHAGPYGRVWVMLQAEARRQLRRPGSLGVWAGLALALYAVALVAPTAVGVSRLLLGYFAAGRLMSGLRTLSGSAGLRRALGGGEWEQRLTHVIVPALGTALWWAATAPAGGVHLDGLELILVAGVVAAAYRGATRPPVSYGGAVFETPMGLFPMELVIQLARGFDVLGAVLLVRLLAGR